MTVSSDQRHTRSHRCPVCGGADGDPRGKEKRCNGFTSDDGQWCHCSRGELAGAISQNGAALFAHRLHGSCKCGTQHGAEIRLITDAIEIAYDYTDEAGELLYQVVRRVGKRFSQRKPDGAGGWIWKIEGVRRVLYRLPELIADDSDRPVYVVEGERDADAVVRLGQSSTCNSGGAGKWGAVASDAKTVLAGRDVIVIADRDKPGEDHAREVEASLRDVVQSIRIVQAPAPHKDVSDLLSAGGNLDQLVPLTSGPDAAEDTTPKARSLVERARDIRSRGPVVRLSTGLETLDANCLGGLAVHRVVVVGGAPGAGKTALVVWLLWTWAKAGVQVALLAVDESADDIVMRLGALEGFNIEKLEARDADEWSAFDPRHRATRLPGKPSTARVAVCELPRPSRLRRPVQRRGGACPLAAAKEDSQSPARCKFRLVYSRAARDVAARSVLTVPRIEYSTPRNEVVSSGLREALIANGAITPAESRGTNVTFWHPEPTTLRMLGNENTAPQSWRELRTQEEKP